MGQHAANTGDGRWGVAHVFVYVGYLLYHDCWRAHLSMYYYRCIDMYFTIINTYNDNDFMIIHDYSSMSPYYILLRCVKGEYK